MSAKKRKKKGGVMESKKSRLLFFIRNGQLIIKLNPNGTATL